MIESGGLLYRFLIPPREKKSRLSKQLLLFNIKWIIALLLLQFPTRLPELKFWEFFFIFPYYSYI